jgi:hypothetical protein
MEYTKIGSPRCYIEQVNGIYVVLQEVKFMPEPWVGLYSINKVIKNGLKIFYEDIIIHLSKGSTALSFYSVMMIKNGFVSGL